MTSIPLPSLSRSDSDFWPTGGYWRGSPWLPTSYMTIKALDARAARRSAPTNADESALPEQAARRSAPTGGGDYALARRLARETVFGMFETYRTIEPHTIWECYSPTEAKPGTYAKKPGYSRPEFCGWSALGPISLFIEDIIGVKQADAFANRLVCDFPAAPVGRVGVENYRFGNVVCDIVATACDIAIESNAPFTLVADGCEHAVSAGANRFLRDGKPHAEFAECAARNPHAEFAECAARNPHAEFAECTARNPHAEFAECAEGKSHAENAEAAVSPSLPARVREGAQSAPLDPPPSKRGVARSAGGSTPCEPAGGSGVAAPRRLFGDWRDALPRPVFEERPELVDFYYRAWEIAHTHIVNVPGLPMPRYMDCGHRSDRIWIWDTCFMALYCKYAPQEFPGIESLENFYSLLLDDDGRPLPRVVGNRWCGEEEGQMLDFMVHHPDNPPLFAWTELSYALQTGDRARLERVCVERRWLQRWFDFFDAFDPDAPKPRGTCVPVKLRRCDDGYHWAGCPSGMDNTPRGRTVDCPSDDAGRCPDNPDLLWIDALAQQGLSALCISRIAAILGRDAEADTWRAAWATIRNKVNSLYWDDADGFYYDILATDHSKVKVMTIASFWPLLAGMPEPNMADRLVEKLSDSQYFDSI